MANTIVTDVTGLMATNVTNLTAGLTPAKSNDSGIPEFSEIMNGATSKTEMKSEVKSEINTGATSVDKRGIKNIKSNDAGENDREEIAEDVVKAVNSVEKKIKETFEVSDERFEEAMNTLGMTVLDLMDPAKLSELLMQINGVEDSISLITNAQMYGDIKSVMEFAANEINNLMQENGIETKDINDILNDDELMTKAFEQFKTQGTSGIDNDTVKASPDIQKNDSSVSGSQTGIKGIENAEDTGIIDESSTQKVEVEIVSNDILSQKVENVSVEQISDEALTKITESAEADGVAVTSGTDANQKTDSIDKDNALMNTESQNNAQRKDDTPDANLGKTETFTEVNKTENNQPKLRTSEGFDNISKLFGNAEEGVAGSAGSTVNVTQVNTVGDVVNTITTYSSANPEEIISQVTQSIRVNITEDITSMELQLHPASLGTVNMQVSSNNGVVTAHLVVQNEAVKAALETQLITLQETFESQGQKVEAVEVSVAGYDLNRESGQNNADGNNSKEQKNGFRVSGTRRRINLNLADETEEGEVISEDEKIARDMMARNGNTVDYSV